VSQTFLVPEEALIPYKASTFSARRVLVLAPHPDDEVLGCGAALADLRARGADLLVQILTDGAGEEPDPEVRRRIGERRLTESGVALALLGGGVVRSAGFRDRGLWAAFRDLSASIERTVAAIAPDLVFCPSPVEIHPDHRAAAAALIAAGVSTARDSEAARLLARATVAFFELSQPFRPNFLFDCGPHRETKRRAAAAFVSQHADRDYAGFMEGLNAYRRMTLPRETTAAEGYFVVSGADLARGVAVLSREMGPFTGESR
jgi:LmbE family N-acetylglucosaminyl deacetylase